MMNSPMRSPRLTMRVTTAIGALLAIVVLPARAQGQEQGSNRLRAVLPAQVAERVIAKIAEARARDLPAEALEQRALKFAAKGVQPSRIEGAVAEHATRLGRSKETLDRARGRRSSGEEIEAGAEALRLGVDGNAVAELARTAPSGRSVAVPLYVVGSLVSRGLPADSALARVRRRLEGRASDAEIEQLVLNPAPGAAGRARAAELRDGSPGRASEGASRSQGRGAGAPGVPRSGGERTKPERVLPSTAGPKKP